MKNPVGDIKIDVRLEEKTVWLTQKLMAQLFQVKPQNITMHLKNIYLEGKLNEEATCKEFLQVQTEGSRKVERKQKFYNLDAIISVGYRIKSQVATQFRIWATQRLKEYIVKGFALNDDRFKSGSSMDRGLSGNYILTCNGRCRYSQGADLIPYCIYLLHSIDF